MSVSETESDSHSVVSGQSDSDMEEEESLCATSRQPGASSTGLVPYSFEPVRHDSLSTWSDDSRADSPENDSSEDDEGGPADALGLVGMVIDQRMGHTNWCTCGLCSIDTLSNAAEHCCCQEYTSISTALASSGMNR